MTFFVRKTHFTRQYSSYLLDAVINNKYIICSNENSVMQTFSKYKCHCKSVHLKGSIFDTNVYSNTFIKLGFF